MEPNHGFCIGRHCPDAYRSYFALPRNLPQVRIGNTELLKANERITQLVKIVQEDKKVKESLAALALAQSAQRDHSMGNPGKSSNPWLVAKQVIFRIVQVLVPPECSKYNSIPCSTHRKTSRCILVAWIPFT